MEIDMSRTLKAALLADAAASGAAGLLLIAGSFFLAGFLGLPAAVMLWVGVAFIPWTVLVAMTARGEQVNRPAVYAIIILNLAWVAASFWAAFGPVFAPTLYGKIFLVAQALAVLGFAEFQMLGLKRSRPAANQPLA
jgi:hypothetical protein